MSDHTPPNSSESHNEFATDMQPTSSQKRPRRTNRTSLAAAAVCFVLVVAVGTTYAWTATFASTTPAWADDAHADLVTTQNLEADIAILFEKVSVDLDARVKAKTDAIVQQAADRQIATLLERLEQNLTISREITKRVDSQLALRGN